MKTDADGVRTLLIKPGCTFDESLHSLPDNFDKPGGLEAISQKIKPSTDPPDERLVRVLLDLQRRQ